MSAFAGAQGYENLSLSQQQDRSAVAFQNGLARKPSAPPAQLSRVLYIPAHHNSEFRMEIHNVSAEYKHAIGHAPMGGSDVIGDALMGSRLFMTRLGNMKKPPVDIQESQVQHVVDVKAGANEAVMTVQCLSAQGPTQTMDISLPSSTDDFKLTIGDGIEVHASFPIPDTVSDAGTTQNPFFTLSTPDGTKKLQWQIHPLETGPLRYTLVETGPVSDDNVQGSLPKMDDIRAIYHHIGQSPSLSLCNGEGVLLLPADKSEESVVMEELAVASLLGLLWRVRSMQVKPPVISSPQEKRKSLLGRIFK